MKNTFFITLGLFMVMSFCGMAQNITTSIAPPMSGSGTVGQPMIFEATIGAEAGPYTNFQWTLSFPSNVVSTPNAPTGSPYTWSQIDTGIWQANIANLPEGSYVTVYIEVMPTAPTTNGPATAITAVTGFFENNVFTDDDSSPGIFFIEASNNVIAVTPNTSVIAPGQSVTLTASGCTGGTYSWNTGQTGASITVTPNTIGMHNYEVTCSTGGSATASVTVQNNSISITPPSSTVSAGTQVVLTASGCNGGTYSWTNSSGSPAGTPSGTGNNTYTVIAGAGTFDYTASCSTGGQATATIAGQSVACPANAGTLN